MAFDPNSALGQSDSIYAALSDYFAGVASAVQSGGSFPVLSDMVTALKYDELHRTALSGEGNAASFIVGSAVETVHTAVAVAREYAMRVKSKSEYYSDSQSDATNEEEFYRAMRTFHTSMLQGNFIDGSMS